MSINIRLLTPIVTKGIRTLDEVKPLEGHGLAVSHSLLESGPASIESEFDEALAVPDTIRIAIEAENSGADAIIIDCMGDPGLHACREAVSIPVLGAGQTAMHLANMLGHRFSFITVLDRIEPMIERIIGSYGLTQKYASFQAIDVPVLELMHDVQALNAALSAKAIASIEEDRADAIVLGCTGFFGCAATIAETLHAAGYRVPVIDPIPAAVHVAEALIKAGLSHSKVGYPAPDEKLIAGYAPGRYAA